MTDVKLTMPNAEKLRALAEETFYSKRSANRFLRFAQLWYEDEKKNLASDLSYASEWMKRFKQRSEYLDSDYDRVAYLFEIDTKQLGMGLWAQQLADYNNIPFEKAYEEVKRKAERVKPLALKGKSVRAPAKKKQKKCICNAAHRMIGELPKIEGKNFL